jgi:hypothetical protein
MATRTHLAAREPCQQCTWLLVHIDPESAQLCKQFPFSTLPAASCLDCWQLAVGWCKLQCLCPVSLSASALAFLS